MTALFALRKNKECSPDCAARDVGPLYPPLLYATEMIHEYEALLLLRKEQESTHVESFEMEMKR